MCVACGVFMCRSDDKITSLWQERPRGEAGYGGCVNTTGDVTL